MRTFKDVNTGRVFEVKEEDIFDALPEEMVRECDGYSGVDGNEYHLYNQCGNQWLVEDEDILSDFVETETYFQYWENGWVAVCIRSLDGVSEVEEVLNKGE